MLVRALLVLLLVLNIGVAAWWLLRAPPAAQALPALPGGVPELELVGAPAPPMRADAPAGGTAPVPVPPVATAPDRCFRIGPFQAPAPLEAAREALTGRVRWTATARQPLTPPRGWRVVLPQPTREQAQATAARIGAAGFTDYLVLPATGADANAIALGRYRSEDAARERARTLAAAGFQAVAEPVGGREALWLDVAADDRFASDGLGDGLQATVIECSGVVRGGRYTIPAPA